MEHGNSLRRAEKIVTGARQDAYGDPAECFEAIADMWTSYLRPKLKEGEELTAIEVPFLMILLKIARERQNPGANIDNIDDIQGYAITAEMIQYGNPFDGDPKEG